MSEDSLRRAKANAEAGARAQEAEARRYNQLAAVARKELTHKQEQLRKAKAAAEACAKVASSNTSFENALEDYGRTLGYCLDTNDILPALRRLVTDDGQLVSNAQTAARDLVEKLEAECAALSSQVQSYESQASVAARRAVSYRTDASNAQRELDRL
jgi:hypothetical protein